MTKTDLRLTDWYVEETNDDSKSKINIKLSLL